MNLESVIEEIFRLGETQKKALRKLGIKTVKNLLYHFPTRYGDTSKMQRISDLTAGENAVVFGKIQGLKTSKAFRKKIPMGEAFIEDETDRIKAIWFNQPYIAKMFENGSFVRIEGRVSSRKNSLYFSNPKIENVAKMPQAIGDSLFVKDENKPDHLLYPIYPESRGITSNWLYHRVKKIFLSGLLDTLYDDIPEELINKYNLPTLKTALVWIHTPRKESDALAARKRFAFEEIFFIQLEKMRLRMKYLKESAFSIKSHEEEIAKFINCFDFKLTSSQTTAVKSILEDFKKSHPMSRLLEGDAGSGKTAVAAITAFSVVNNRPNGQDFGNLQVAYMTPTEILAVQQFESFIKYFSHLFINIGLITGSECRKFPSKVNPKGWTSIPKNQLLKWAANGEIPILIGTHSLIEKKVRFKNLAYVVIDEQHRFGTNQRQKLARKDGVTPHLLSMTATPIPRTLALTIFGDLDLTLIDEMPPGRKTVETKIITPNTRGSAYEKMRAEIRAGRQAYVICPRIDEPDLSKEMALNAKSVKEEAKRLKKDVFPDLEIGIMHSKMKPAEKDNVMKTFVEGKIDILVSTSVIEVGVNVPNATVILIEGAERFGLAQLHQLRGRVLRSDHQPYCFIYRENQSEKSFERLKALTSAKNGFELAEMDLRLRGAGELYGAKQWGISDLAMEALKNIKMVEAARAEAQQIVETDPELKNFPRLREKLTGAKSVHFE